MMWRATGSVPLVNSLNGLERQFLTLFSSLVAGFGTTLAKFFVMLGALVTAGNGNFNAHFANLLSEVRVVREILHCEGADV